MGSTRFPTIVKIYDGTTKMIELATIGFAQKSAQRFFSLISDAGVQTVIDTRAHNTNQLAGFAKKDDLAFFLTKLLGVSYIHWLESAPTDDILFAFKKKKMTWDQYEKEYRALVVDRRLHESSIATNLNHCCLLCSEAKPHQCHRRILAEYLQEMSPGRISVRHLI